MLKMPGLRVEADGERLRSPTSEPSPMCAPNDFTLLLRVHAEHEWLQDELLGLLAELEDPAGLEAGDLGATLAYLEVTWAEEVRRAQRTDAVYRRMEREGEGNAGLFVGQARSYYRWLRALRTALAGRVEPYVGVMAAHRL